MCLKLTYYKIVWVRVKVEVLGTGNPNPNLTLNANGFFFSAGQHFRRKDALWMSAQEGW